MAKVKEITVGVTFRVGFKNSYSSMEVSLGERIELEEGDKKADVREQALERLEKQVVQEAEYLRETHDTPATGGKTNGR